MRVAYLSSFSFFQNSNGEVSSNGASARYRITLPGPVLARMGHQLSLDTITESALNNPQSAAASLQADVVVLSKFFDPRTAVLFDALKKRGLRVIADFCDNHFGNPTFGPAYLSVAAAADQIVCNSQTMAGEIRQLTGRDARVIDDPVEGRKNEPRFAPSLPAIKMAWYGFPQGLPFLSQRLQNWIDRGLRYPVEVEIVTAPSPDVSQHFDAVTRASKGQCSVKITPWSTAAVWKAIREADCILVPSELNPMTKTKSANRLAEAIYGGRLALASPLPSYVEFADFCVLDDHQGADDALINVTIDRQTTEKKIEAGQDYIERRYLPLHAAQAWDKMFRGVDTSAPLRLNLGCGDKILPQYVNVDIVSSRAGMTPDVLCDLRHLKPFADGSASEILSVHVVEHFWRWEVRDILKEWRRVLAPGGKIVLECPNLEVACQTFLEDPQRRSAEDQGGQRSMWVFYGDPSWRDPYMVHRWGYTVQSLAELLRECGFVNVRQEPAQYKLREPRDMRVVGEKPIH